MREEEIKRDAERAQQRKEELAKKAAEPEVTPPLAIDSDNSSESEVAAEPEVAVVQPAIGTEFLRFC